MTNFQKEIHEDNLPIHHFQHLTPFRKGKHTKTWVNHEHTEITAICCWQTSRIIIVISPDKLDFETFF